MFVACGAVVARICYVVARPRKLTRREVAVVRCVFTFVDMFRPVFADVYIRM